MQPQKQSPLSTFQNILSKTDLLWKHVNRTGSLETVVSFILLNSAVQLIFVIIIIIVTLFE